MTKGYIDTSVYDDPWDESTRTIVARIGYISDSLLDLTSAETGIAFGKDLEDTSEPYIIVTSDTFKISLQEQKALCFDANEDTYIYSIQDDEIIFEIGGVTALGINENAIEVYSEDGSLVTKWINRSGDTYGTKPDLYFHDRGGLAADHSLLFFIDANNTQEPLGDDARFGFYRDGDSHIEAIELMRITEDGEIWLTDDGVAHGATGIIDETQVYGSIGIEESGAGGLKIMGFKDEDVETDEEGGAVTIYGALDDNVETGINATARSIVEIRGGQISGTGWSNITPNGNVFAVVGRVDGTWKNCIIVDEDGDLYYRGATGDFDEEDDAQAASDLYSVMCGSKNTVRYSREMLSNMGIIGDDPDEVYVSHKGTTAIVLGAIRQMNDRQRKILASLSGLEKRVLSQEEEK